MGAPDRREARRRQETGEVFGRYRLLGTIAAGGMATVDRARMECPGGVRRNVAIKRMLPHLNQRDDVREMFVDEARIALRLGHPNLCAALDFGQVGDEPYLAMEYLDGKSIGEVTAAVQEAPRLRSSAAWLAIAARVVAEACEGLHHAHQALDEDGLPLRVVHRDVSPANVVLGFDGSVKVVDFGIARFADRMHETQCGAIKGKMEFMAPEQMLGGAVDARTDVFGLGVTLWTMLVGQDPSDAVGVVAGLASQSLPPPSSVRSGVPRALDAIVLRAIRRDPAHRYSTAREMGRELHAFLRTLGAATETAERADFLAGLFAEERSGRIELAKTRLPEDVEEEDSVHSGVTRILHRDTPTPIPPPMNVIAPVIAPPPPVPAPVLAAPPSAKVARFARIVALVAAGIVLLEIVIAIAYVAAS